MENQMMMRSIEIDFEVHKAIEMERLSFDETPNIALRRLLGMGPAASKQVESPPASGRPWVGKGQSSGLTLPHATDLRMDYNGQRFIGQVENGALVFEGKHFSSPSGAADGLCRTKKGRRTSLNGKELISVCFPGETDWVLLKTHEQRSKAATS